MRVRLAVLVLVLLAVAAGCANGEEAARPSEATSPEAALSEAASKTENARTAHMEFDGRISGGQIPDAVVITGAGEFDFERRVGAWTYQMSGLPGAREFHFEVIQDGLVVYMRLPREARAGLPGGKPWMKIDLDALGRQTRVDLGELAQVNQADPSRMLLFLRGASTSNEEIGEREVRGVETTGYRANVDLKKAVQQSLRHMPKDMHGVMRSEVDRLIQQTGTRTIPMDVWIDDDGLARRMKMTFDFDVPGEARKGHSEMTMDFFDFGAEVDVDVPPRDQVVDLLRLLERAER